MEKDINNFLAKLNIPLILTDTQINQLILFYNLLIEKNKVINLTRITDKKEYIIKHVIDSIIPLLKLNFTSGTVLDVGSGAGFPGIIIKILFPETFVILAESITKKAAFLKEAIEVLTLNNIIVLNKRSEQISFADCLNKKIDLVTNRAVASLSKIIGLIPRVINKNTKILCYKGPNLQNELLEFSRLNTRFNYHHFASFTLPLNMGNREYVILKLKV